MRPVIWIVAATLLFSNAHADDPEPFPDEWFFGAAERPEPLKSLEGKEAAQIDIAEWRGEEASLEDLRGKVVVLDFWATWCGPCMAAIPKNVDLVDRYGDEGLAFIGVHDANGGWDAVDGVIADKGINYPVALDASGESSGKSAAAYNLQFWPTYVVIDRTGIVRGAGLVPAHVEDAVKLLLAEPYEGAPADQPQVAGFPDEWFYGAEQRPAWLRAAEGKPLKQPRFEQWLGQPLAPGSLERRVVVVQFVRPGFAPSLARLRAITPLAERYERQGVVFLAIGRSDDWDRMTEKAPKLPFPIARDLPNQDGRDVLATALGARFGTETAVVDRAGIVRAIGLKTEHLERVINTLLAERLPAKSGEPGSRSEETAA